MQSVTRILRCSSFHKKLAQQEFQEKYLFNFKSFSTSYTAKADIVVDVDNGIRKIRMNRPDKKNAITQQMYSDIGANLEQSNGDENTNVIVITGTGDYFTSGNDINTFLALGRVENPTNEPLRNEPFKSLVRGLINCRKPVVALVNGPAVGIGVTLLGLCDTSYSSDRATFSTPFAMLGIAPECCSSYTLPRIMGYAKANELLALNAKLSAKEACDSGLIAKVFPDDQFETEAWKLIDAMAKLPIKSIMYSKELVRGQKEREFLQQVAENEDNLFDNALVAAQIRKLFAHKLKK